MLVIDPMSRRSPSLPRQRRRLVAKVLPDSIAETTWLTSSDDAVAVAVTVSSSAGATAVAPVTVPDTPASASATVSAFADVAAVVPSFSMVLDGVGGAGVSFGSCAGAVGHFTAAVHRAGNVNPSRLNRWKRPPFGG